MESRDLVLTAFDNVEDFVRGALDGIDPALLTERIDPEANTVAWLVWHLTRVQDDHVDPQLLVDYHKDVHRRTAAFVRTVTTEDLDRIVDRRWDPPVTLGVRLVSVIGDDLQHAGQAALLRGLLERR
jgi:hypothetical protein